MIANKGGFNGEGLRWEHNPLDILYQLWPEIVKKSGGCTPHLVGTAKTGKEGFIELRTEVVCHEKQSELVFSESDVTYFVIPVNPGDGVDGTYLKMLRSLGVFR